MPTRQALTFLWLLSLAVVLTLLGAWLLFPWEIAELSLPSAAGLSAETIQSNFNQLMTYLLNPLVQSLKMTDFPVSVSGAKHFTDVKHLFLLAEGVCLVLAFPAMSWLRQACQTKQVASYRRLTLTMMVLPLLLAGLGLVIGFDNFFILFHTVLFPGDSSWLFNPATDPVILILPETYFLHCFILFMALYEGLLAGLLVMSYRYQDEVH